LTDLYQRDSFTACPRPSFRFADTSAQGPVLEPHPDSAAARRTAGLASALPANCDVTPIVCQIIGSDRCEHDGLVVKHNAPVLALCRKLIEAGYDPAAPLHAYRRDTLCLKIRTIAEGAKLTVEEGPNGPRLIHFRQARTCVSAPPMRPNDGPAIAVGGR
jgi:hypothetical protein